jgi:hypothetical protein
VRGGTRGRGHSDVTAEEGEARPRHSLWPSGKKRRGSNPAHVLEQGAWRPAAAHKRWRRATVGWRANRGARRGGDLGGGPRVGWLLGLPREQEYDPAQEE